MTIYHEAQLPDGRWARIRELTSAQQAQAYEAAAERGPGGVLLPPNPLKLDVECFKMALAAITVRKPLYRTVEGKPVQRVVDGKPLTRADGKTPVYERFDPADLDEKDWSPLTYAGLETSFDEIFGPRDRSVIATLYARAHNPSEEDRDFFETIRSVVESG
jgi:hypothetical protein